MSVDKSHVVEYVPPEGSDDPIPPELTDKSHVVEYVSPPGPDGSPGMDSSHIKTPYVSPRGPKDPDAGGMDRSHVTHYVTPEPDPEDEPQPDPEVVARTAWAKELAEHAELVRRLKEQDRQRAAKSVEPTSKEGQD